MSKSVQTQCVISVLAECPFILRFALKVYVSFLLTRQFDFNLYWSLEHLDISYLINWYFMPSWPLGWERRIMCSPSLTLEPQKSKLPWHSSPNGSSDNGTCVYSTDNTLMKLSEWPIRAALMLNDHRDRDHTGWPKSIGPEPRHSFIVSTAVVGIVMAIFFPHSYSSRPLWTPVPTFTRPCWT